MLLRMERIALLLVLAGPLLSCIATPHQAYRDRQCRNQLVRSEESGGLDADCFLESDGGPEAGSCSTESHPGYDLAFLEFNDQGGYFEPCELDRANYLVDQANVKAKKADPQKGGAIVVVFVHGWRNNASEVNAKVGNLANFKQTLAELADLEAACIRGAETSEDRARCPAPRPIVGIYVAWRGDYLRTLGPLRPLDWMVDWATFWNRNAAAERIATRPIATQALLLLLENVKAEYPNARVIAVGHSMGALLLEAAVSQTLVTRVIDRIFEARQKKARLADQAKCDGKDKLVAGKKSDDEGETSDEEIRVRPLADLVVFVNSAAQAVRAQSLVDTLQIRKIHLDTPQPITCEREEPPQQTAAVSGPLLISVTARNDNATGWLFPKALTLSTRRQKFQRSNDPAGRRPTEKYLARHTPGHTPQLFSHRELHYRQQDLPCQSAESTAPAGDRRITGGVSSFTGVIPCAESTKDGSILAFSVRSKDGFGIYRLLRDTFATNHSLYWILQVPPEVIDGHSKIFEQPFRDFLRGLIVVTGAIDPNVTRTYGAPVQPSESTDMQPVPDQAPTAPPVQ